MDFNELIKHELSQLTILNEGVFDPGIFKVIWMAGGPGSGKGFIGKKIVSGNGLKFVNTDTLFELFLKRENRSLNLIGLSKSEISDNNKIRGKAKDLTDIQLKNYLDGRLGLVIDGTSREFIRIKKQKDKLTDLGYDPYMIFVNTSLDVSLERNKTRKRKVPEEIVKQSWKDVQSNIGKFQREFGSKNFIIIDNNKVDEDILHKASKQITKFIKLPPKNIIAKNWIKIELEKRKRD